MRFRVRVELWIDVDDIDQAQASADTMESAAYDSVAAMVVPSPSGGSLARMELDAMDEAARAALAADDLGPGITSARFEYGRPDPGG